MNIIIVGAGKVGFTAANQLAREGHGVTVIEKDDSALEDALEAMEIAAVPGSGVNLGVLEEAGAETADLLIALTGSDEQNLLSCLIAKRLGTRSTIARVRNLEFSSALPIIAEDLGLSMAVNPDREAALEITRILSFPLANKVETFSRGKVEMIDCSVDASSPMRGKLVKDAFAGMSSALVCAVERRDQVFIPLGDFRFEEGDVMTVVAPTGRMSEFFRDSGLRTQSVKRVIISGGGRTCRYLADELISRRIGVTIIEQDPRVAQLLSEQLPKASVVVGDGTSQSMLDEEGISAVDAFCCLTGIDEENILASLYAKRSSPGIKTVTKINRVELVPLISPLGIGSVVSPKLIAADRVVSYVRARQNSTGSGVLTLYKIVSGKAEAIEFEVQGKSKVTGVPISRLKLRDNVIIASINRDGEIISPRGSDALLAGDTVIIVTTHSGFKVLDDIVRG